MDFKKVQGQITEVEMELVRIGSTSCNQFQDKSQLTAVLVLLLRASSLLRSIVNSFECDALDAYDVLRRAYLESWLLAFEFRLKDSKDQSVRWYNDGKDSWSPNIKRLETYCKDNGLTKPMLGKDYGGLCEVAHPTREAAENSLVIVGARHGEKFLQVNMIQAKDNFEKNDLPGLLYRYIWLVIDDSDTLIPLGVNRKLLPTAMEYTEQFERNQKSATEA